VSHPTEDRLKEIFTKVFLIEGEQVHDKLSRKDVEEWDSMGHLMLINEVESTFNVFISDEDIAKIKTVGDIKKVLRKLGVAI